MFSLPLFRIGVLCTTSLLAFIVLALSAYVLSQVADFDIFFSPFASLGVATAVLHLCSVIPMIVLGRMREGAITSKLALEVGWLSFLWIMWIATGGEAATTVGLFIYGCGGSGVCGASQAVAAFAFLNWAMILAYVVTLISFAVKSSLAGQNVWLVDVKHVHWVQGPIDGDKPNFMAPNFTGGTYPPQGTSPVTPLPQYAGSNPVGVISPGPPMPQHQHQHQHPGGNPGQFTPQPQYYQQGGTMPYKS